MEIKNGTCRNAFQQEAKKYVINMIRGSKRTLHVKNTSCCPWSKYLMEYIDFDTLEEAEICGVEFVKCQNCFKE